MTDSQIDLNFLCSRVAELEKRLNLVVRYSKTLNSKIESLKTAFETRPEREELAKLQQEASMLQMQVEREFDLGGRHEG